MLGWGVTCWGGALRFLCVNQNSATLQPDSSTSNSPSLPPCVYKCALLLGRVSAVCMCPTRSQHLFSVFRHAGPWVLRALGVSEEEAVFPYIHLDGSSDPTGKEVSWTSRKGNVKIACCVLWQRMQIESEEIINSDWEGMWRLLTFAVFAIPNLGSY